LVPGNINLSLVPDVIYSMSVTNLRPPAYVQDILYQGRSILGGAFRPDEGGGELQIIVGSDSGVLRVAVSRGPGPIENVGIVIFSAEALSEQALATSLIAEYVDGQGQFVQAGLAPGQYFVLALRNLPSGAMNGGRLRIDRVPETLRRLLTSRSLGQLVTIGEGATVNILVPVETLP
jgi:hypothetical protein